jgi:hypothetical protein
LNDVAALNDLLPVVLLLLFGIGTSVASRLLRISPIVGYTRIAVIRDEAEAKDVQAIGISPVHDRLKPRGVAVASALLAELGIPTGEIAEWRNRISAPATNPSDLVSAPA